MNKEYSEKFKVKISIDSCIEQSDNIKFSPLKEHAMKVLDFREKGKIVFATVNSLIFFTAPSLKLENRVKAYTGCTIKLNEDFIIYVNGGKECNSYEVDPPYKKKSLAIPMEAYVCMRITNDLFLIQCCPSTIFFIQHSSQKIIKRFKVGNIVYNPFIVLSSYHPNCFYISIHEKNDPVRMIDFDKEILKKEFVGHTTAIYSICPFQNSRNEEMIIVLGRKCENIYCYNSCTEEFTKDIELPKDITNSRSFLATGDSDYHGNKILNDQYLFFASEPENICVLEIKEIIGGNSVRLEKLFSNIDKESPRDDDSSRELFVFSKTENSVEFILGSSRIEFKGLKFREIFGQSKIDLDERVLFITEEIDSFIFSMVEKKKILTSIKMINFEMKNICKIFFFEAEN